MDTFQSFAYASASWLALQAAALLVSPRLVLTMLTTTLRETSDLETYLARSFAIALLALSLLALLLSGALPVPNTSGADTSPDSTYRAPAIIIITAYHLFSAIYAYSNWAVTSQTGYLLGLVGSGGLACFGGGTIMFSNEMSASKGSGWMFPTAAKRQRKADKREAREEKWENIKKAL